MRRELGRVGLDDVVHANGRKLRVDWVERNESAWTWLVHGTWVASGEAGTYETSANEIEVE